MNTVVSVQAALQLISFILAILSALSINYPKISFFPLSFAFFVASFLVNNSALLLK